MHPASLISFYPTYQILDQITSYGPYKTLNIFIDLKNVLQTTYMEHAMVNIIENTKMSRSVDTSVFSSLISFLSFHKMWGVKRGVNTNFHVFMEKGDSYYHKNISKFYKISRKIDTLYGLDKKDKDLFGDILQKNFQLIESACNKLPHVNVINMANLEADFIPYYALTRGLVERGSGIGNVIYSSDHDMWQCLDEDVHIFSKAGKNKKIVNAGNAMELLLKRKSEIPDKYLTLAMAIIGDKGDDVYGVKGVGPAAFVKMFNELINMTGNLEQINKKVQCENDLFDFIPDSIVDKGLKKVVDAELGDGLISKNLQLVSFELISRSVEDPVSTEMLERRKYIESRFGDDEVASLDGMKNALDRCGVILEESSIDFLYI